MLAGEIKSKSSIDEKQIARVIKKVTQKPEYLFDYKSCEIKSFLHEQSPDINRGVEKEIAENYVGDQARMFGYACDETENTCYQHLIYLTKFEELVQEESQKNKFKIDQITSYLEYSDMGPFQKNCCNFHSV